MQRRLGALRIAAAIAMLVPVVAAAADAVPALRASGPTIVAFFPPVAQKQVTADADLSETLGDFQIHLRRAKQRLEASGIKVHELYTRQFQVEISGAVRMFRPAKNGIGYYFIRPGSEPRIEYDVMSDVDIVDAAAQYFGKPDLTRPR